VVQSARKQPPLSVEDYLALEASAAVKHEYVAGALHAQAGASRRHNRIALTIASKLLSAAHDTPCRVSISDVKLRIDDGNSALFYYPDVMVACGPEPQDPLIETEPCLLVEVTSPSTESIDRREKWLSYRRLLSLKVYVIVHQEERRVSRHYRDETGMWWHAEVAGEGLVPLPCPELTLSLEGIYEGSS
jgi:Uma2 family endonuclease